MSRTQYGVLLAFVSLVTFPLIGCHREGSTQFDLNQQAAQGQQIAKVQMTTEKDDSQLGSKESENLLLAGAREFCENTYGRACEGSVCPMCIEGCKKKLFDWRRHQLEAMRNDSLEFVSASKVRIGGLDKLMPYIKILCQTPAAKWKNQERPKECEQRAFGELESQVLGYLRHDPKNDGEVCAQL